MAAESMKGLVVSKLRSFYKELHFYNVTLDSVWLKMVKAQIASCHGYPSWHGLMENYFGLRGTEMYSS